MTHIGPSLGKREGILCGNLSGAFVYNFESNSIPTSSSQSATTLCQGSQHTEKQVPLHVQGASCYSVSLDDVSMEWVASYKFLGKPFTEHIRGTLERHDDESDMFLKSKHKVTGGCPVPCLARTSLFSRRDGSIHLAVGSEGVVSFFSLLAICFAESPVDLFFNMVFCPFYHPCFRSMYGTIIQNPRHQPRRLPHQSQAAKTASPSQR